LSVVEELRKSTQGSDAFGIDFIADTVETAPDEAISLGIIVNELVTNALKYAYPSSGGPVRVKLASTFQRITLSVEDDGRGYDPDGAGRSGLGSRIIRIMAEKLGGQLDVKSSSLGTAVSLTWPGRAIQPAA
jgi:two-component sensor histidine kinase